MQARNIPLLRIPLRTSFPSLSRINLWRRITRWYFKFAV
jgi:hypothetical protein